MNGVKVGTPWRKTIPWRRGGRKSFQGSRQAPAHHRSCFRGSPKPRAPLGFPLPPPRHRNAAPPPVIRAGSSAGGLDDDTTVVGEKP